MTVAIQIYSMAFGLGEWQRYRVIQIHGSITKCSFISYCVGNILGEDQRCCVINNHNMDFSALLKNKSLQHHCSRLCVMEWGHTFLPAPLMAQAAYLIVRRTTNCVGLLIAQGLCKSKIGHFDISVSVHKKIFRFQITVNNSFAM